MPLLRLSVIKQHKNLSAKGLILLMDTDGMHTVLMNAMRLLVRLLQLLMLQ